MITGCHSNSRIYAPVGYLSEDPSKFSMLVISDGEYNVDWHAWQENNKIYNVSTITVEYKTDKEAKKTYKTLGIDKLPFYVLFNTSQLVYKTSSEQNLIEYLLENKP